MWLVQVRRHAADMRGVPPAQVRRRPEQHRDARGTAAAPDSPRNGTALWPNLRADTHVNAQTLGTAAADWQVFKKWNTGVLDSFLIEVRNSGIVRFRRCWHCAFDVDSTELCALYSSRHRPISVPPTPCHTLTLALWLRSRATSSRRRTTSWRTGAAPVSEST